MGPSGRLAIPALLERAELATDVLRVEPEVPACSDQVRLDQTGLDVAPQRAAGQAETLRGLARRQQLLRRHVCNVCTETPHLAVTETIATNTSDRLCLRALATFLLSRAGEGAGTPATALDPDPAERDETRARTYRPLHCRVGRDARPDRGDPSRPRARLHRPVQSMRPPGNGHVPPRRTLPLEPNGHRGLGAPHAARPVTSIVLLALTHAGAAVMGGMLTLRLQRPRRRRSSIELAVAGATRQARGRHRR
jgi:hypothetical protein